MNLACSVPFKTVPFAFVSLLAAASLFVSSEALAQNDQVFVDGSNKPQRGSVAAITKDGVQLKAGANTKAIPAGNISKIIFTGDPSELTKARTFAIDGQYEQALEELEKIDASKLKPNAKAEAAFYMMQAKAKMALAGRGNKAKAVQQAMGFVSANRNSYHFYDSAKILGDLALSMNNHPQALKFYGSLASSKSIETKIESVYLGAVTKLKQGETSKALADFEKISGMKADTTGKKRLQTLAQAGKAVGMAKSGKGKEGLALVKQLIAKLNPTDVEMSARIYNAQGDCYVATGDVDGAIMAYLHTHLMFSTQADAHAEALANLVPLWEKAGRPDRVAEARQELQQRYPGFGK